MFGSELLRKHGIDCRSGKGKRSDSEVGNWDKARSRRTDLNNSVLLKIEAIQSAATSLEKDLTCPCTWWGRRRFRGGSGAGGRGGAEPSYGIHTAAGVQSTSLHPSSDSTRACGWDTVSSAGGWNDSLENPIRNTKVLQKQRLQGQIRKQRTRSFLQPQLFQKIETNRKSSGLDWNLADLFLGIISNHEKQASRKKTMLSHFT